MNHDSIHNDDANETSYLLQKNVKCVMCIYKARNDHLGVDNANGNFRQPTPLRIVITDYIYYVFFVCLAPVQKLLV